MTLIEPNLIRRQIALYARRVKELEAELLGARTQLNEDALTGTLNRRGLRQACEDFPLSVEDGVTVVSCVVLDLDNFKWINDQYGHAIGDEALVYFSQFLRTHIRPIDTIARLGGDEFVLIMADMAGRDAVDTVRRLIRSLAECPFLTPVVPQPLSLSAGIAELRTEETMYDAMVRADSALLSAKRSGKSQVVLEL